MAYGQKNREDEDEIKRLVLVRKIKIHEDHTTHNTSWKIAYADFVTAMMAFFLLMWLINATSEEQKKGIADFFNPVTFTRDARSASSGILAGQSVDNEKGAATFPSDGPAVIRNLGFPVGSTRVETDVRRQEQKAFEGIEEGIRDALVKSGMSDLADSLRIETTPDGLRIQIFDRDGTPMFAPGRAEPLPRLNALLGVIAKVLDQVKNPVVVTGHTDGSNFQRANGQGNWELSSERAHAARRSLASSGMAADRFIRVEGRADTNLLIPEASTDPRNRRIAITLLRTGHPDSVRQAAGAPSRVNEDLPAATFPTIRPVQREK